MSFIEQEKDISSVLEYYSTFSLARKSLLDHFDRDPKSAVKRLVDAMTFLGHVSEQRAWEVANAFFYLPLTSPKPGSEYSDLHDPEVSLEEEHKKQAEKMAHLFASKLHMSEEEYMSTLPLFHYKPPTTDNPGLRMFIVEGSRIPWREQAELSGIEIDTSVIGPEGYPGKIPTSEQPYTARAEIWYRSPEATINDQGANVYEGIAYWNTHRKRANNHWLILPESRDSRGRVSLLKCSRFETKLSLHNVNESTKNYGSILHVIKDKC